MPPKAKTAVVVNPAAANGRLGKHLGEITQALREALGDYTLLRTERANHATALTQDALHHGCTRVVSIGGDGTHNEVANGFFAGKQPLNPEAALGIVSYGTGADLARMLKLPRGLAGIHRLAEAAPRLIDTGCVTYGLREGGEAVRYFINIADFGLGGAVVDRVNRSSKFFGGFLSFFYGVVSALAVYRNPVVHLDIDGTRLEDRMVNVIVANGQYYGGGMHVAPDARLDSGQFVVYVIGDVGRIEALHNLPKLYRGTLLRRIDKVDRYFARRITAHSPQEVLLNLDGEQPGMLPATFEMLPQSLRLLV